MEQITELELQELLDRDRILALMNCYFATIDDANGLDAERARSIFSEDVGVDTEASRSRVQKTYL